MAEPTCALCRGKLECLKDVRVERGEVVADYYLAWVCTMCSAAYPIAVHKKFIGGAVPLYTDGRAYDE